MGAHSGTAETAASRTREKVWQKRATGLYLEGRGHPSCFRQAMESGKAEQNADTELTHCQCHRNGTQSIYR